MFFRMFSVFLFSLMMFFSDRTFAQNLGDALQNTKIVKSNFSCFSGNFSSYESWFNSLRAQRIDRFKRQDIYNYTEQISLFENNFTKMFSKSNYELSKGSLDCYFFTYVVGGKEVEGVIVSPKSNRTHKEKHPVIIYNRGGTRDFGNLVFGHVVHELFPIAQKGFSVIASNYRSDEQYGADNIDEVTALFEIIDGISALKSEKVGVYGISRGGLTSWQLAKEVPERIAAIVTINGVTDIDLWIKNRPDIKHNIELIHGYHENSSKVLLKLSPVKWVNEISNPPILLIHALNDESVHVEHSFKIAIELIRYNKKFRMKIFEDGEHSLEKYKNEVTEELVDWFSRYI